MMRFFRSILSICLVICLIIGFLFLWFATYNYNPCGKEWYNNTARPSIAYPFREQYDGSYSITIDRDGNVLVIIDGEEIKGKVSIEKENRILNSTTTLTFEFENGKTAEGYCHWDNDGRSMGIKYESQWYHFSNKSGMTKAEADEYRAGLISFMRGIYDGEDFPTKDEILDSSILKEYTHFSQIDPGHGGPIRYYVLEKATVESIDLDGHTVTLNINGETEQCKFDDNHFYVACIGDGDFSKLTVDDSLVGECLVVREYSTIRDIYFFDNE